MPEEYQQLMANLVTGSPMSCAETNRRNLRHMMTDRDLMVEAGEVLAEHGALTADYIIEQLGDVLGDRIAVEDWRQVVIAIDAITAAPLQ